MLWRVELYSTSHVLPESTLNRMDTISFSSRNIKIEFQIICVQFSLLWDVRMVNFILNISRRRKIVFICFKMNSIHYSRTPLTKLLQKIFWSSNEDISRFFNLEVLQNPGLIKRNRLAGQAIFFCGPVYLIKIALLCFIQKSVKIKTSFWFNKS